MFIALNKLSKRPCKNLRYPYPSLHFIALFSFFLSLASISQVSHASEYKLVENPAKTGQPISDSWVVNYQADDFSDEVKQATVLYIPKNYGKEAALFLRCKPFFTNFSVQYVEQTNQLKENGTLPNASDKFAKHGYLYDDKQTLKVMTQKSQNHYEVSVGGQNKHLTSLFSTNKKIQPDQLGMSFFYSFTFKEMPSFRNGTTSDEGKDFFEQINLAIKNKEQIQLQLTSKQKADRHFSWDTQRMQRFVPTEVMDFCLTNRQLK